MLNKPIVGLFWVEVLFCQRHQLTTTTWTAKLSPPTRFNSSCCETKPNIKRLEKMFGTRHCNLSLLLQMSVFVSLSRTRQDLLAYREFLVALLRRWRRRKKVKMHPGFKTGWKKIFRSRQSFELHPGFWKIIRGTSTINWPCMQSILNHYPRHHLNYKQTMIAK